MSTQNAASLVEMERVYEAYGKSLEAEQWGKYVAISLDGQTVIGDMMLDVAERSTEQFGLGAYLFKIGERSAGRVR